MTGKHYSAGDMLEVLAEAAEAVPPQAQERPGEELNDTAHGPLRYGLIDQEVRNAGATPVLVCAFVYCFYVYVMPNSPATAQRAQPSRATAPSHHELRL
jgi:hypothetical protein